MTPIISTYPIQSNYKQFVHLLCLLLFTCLGLNSIYAQNIPESSSTERWSALPYTQNPETLIAPLKKLEPGKKFTIVHIGDSHVQGDRMTGETRVALQSLFGNGGQGFLFPYGLAGSFGPRGTSATKEGTWIPYKTLTPNLERNLGLTGYGITSYNTQAEIHIAFNDKFAHYPYSAIRVLHSIDTTSFQCFITTNSAGGISQSIVQSKQFRGSLEPGNSWGISEFSLADMGRSEMQQPTPFTGSISAMESAHLEQLHIEFNKTNYTQTHTDFFGYQLLSANNGIEYHHYGVVGAQFPHFINRVKQACDQLAYIQPDLIIFSFGTNEAYNGKLSIEDYQNLVKKFIDSIRLVLPNTGILLTTPPDTRSSGRIPPMQKNVLMALENIAREKEVALFDLNRAMGGWGNIYQWYAKGLTLKDKVHFTTEGYGLQGKMITSCLLEMHIRARSNSKLAISTQEFDYLKDLQINIHQSLDEILKQPISTLNDTAMGVNLSGNSDTAANQILSNQENVISKDSVARINTRKPVNQGSTIRPKNTPKAKSNAGRPIIHTVKSGENLYRIAQKYHVTTDAIAKANHLRNPRAIKPGQKLVIPK